MQLEFRSEVEASKFLDALENSAPEISHRQLGAAVFLVINNDFQATLVLKMKQIFDMESAESPRESATESSVQQPGRSSMAMLEALEEKGDVFWLFPGFAMLSGDFLRVKLALQESVLKAVSSRFSLTHFENPGVWPVSLAISSGHLADFPQESLAFTGLKKNSQSLSKFRSELTPGETGIDLSEDYWREAVGVLQPSVCTSCYQVFGAQGMFDNIVSTTINRVFRDEGRATLTRLSSFTVRDFIVTGEPIFVEKTLELIRDCVTSWFDQIGLKFRLETATDPFFGEVLAKRSFQLAASTKHEFLVGDSEASFAVGSLNRHGNVFGERFGISEKVDTNWNSACLGIGFERLAFGLFLSLGLDLDSWPAQAIRVLEL